MASPLLSLNNEPASGLEAFDVNIDAAGTLVDPDGDPDWNGGTLSFQITNNAHFFDFLLINPGSSGFAVSGANLTFNSTTIATLNTSDGSVAGTNALVMTFNAEATNTIVQAAMRLVAFRPAGDDSSASARTITVVATDANSESATDSREFSVIPVNDAPTAFATALNPTFTEGDSPTSLFSDVTVSTIEAGQAFNALTFQVSNVGNGANEIISFDGTSIALTNGNSGLTTGNSLNFQVTMAGSTAVLELTAPTTPIDPTVLTALLAGMTYANNSIDPTEATRTIALTTLVDNGGNANGGNPVGSPNLASAVNVVSVPNPPVANNDAFSMLENATDSGFNSFFAFLFDDNGNGVDFDPEGNAFSVTHINGVAQTPSSFNNVEVNFASGAYAFVNVDVGTMGFFLDGNYDYLPEGVTFVESFDYTITDSQGQTDTATVSLSITGIDSDDRFVGTAGADTILAGIGNDTVLGVNGNDTLRGQTGNDTLRGGNNNDALFGDQGNDRLYGDAGNDTLRGGVGNDFAYGGLGSDLLYGDSGIDSLFGDAGNDRLFGGSGNDRLYGGDHNDTIYGDANNDFFYGGNGNDKMYGGSGNDTFYGDTGNDTINGGAGLDFLRLTGNEADYRITKVSATTYRVTDLKPSDGNTGTDTLIGIEKIFFSDGSELL